MNVGFAEFMGLPLFIEHLGATASVTKNTGVTNKQHTITANMVDLTKPMFAFVCITMPTSNNFTSSYIVIERATTDWIRFARWNFLFENKK